jgi:RNA polymerase sigma-70 factor, ECF subfamily
MCYFVVIAAILPAWLVGETNKGDASVGDLLLHDVGARFIPSRAHSSMRTKKTTEVGAQFIAPIDKSDAINHVSTDACVLDFGMLYEKFSRPIHSYIYRLLGSQEDADDVTQEVFTRAYIAWNDLYDRDNLSPWLYRIASNLCVDHLRRRKRISWWPLTRARKSDDSGENRLDEDISYLPSDSGGIPEVGEREHIRRTLASMPRDYAIALVLSAAQGIPYQEIGSIMGISPNAAATRISRAKRMFAEEYQRFSDEDARKQE